MSLSWLGELDSWRIVLTLLVVMMVSAEVAFRVGRRLNERAPEASKGHFGTVQGSLLGLLALLLSFTFGMSTQRFEARRLLMIEDANTLNALYLRSTLLPAPQRAEFDRLLRQYIDVRTEAASLQRPPTRHEVEEALARSAMLQNQLWNMARSMAAQDPQVKGADEVLRLLIEVASSTTRRINAFTNRVPDAVNWLLMGAATAGMAVIGFSAGLGKHRGMPARIMLSILVCGTIYVVLDLDHPLRGLIRVDQSPMIRLKQAIDADRPAN